VTQVVKEFQAFDIDVVTQLLTVAQVELHQDVRLPAVVLIQEVRLTIELVHQSDKDFIVEDHHAPTILLILSTKLVIKITVFRIHAWIVCLTGSIM
jgi:hypothetical protein